MSHKQHVRLYVTIACILALLVILNMTVIFRFSAESKEESGSRSAGITALLLPILHPEYDTLSEADQRAAMEQTHHLVRKLAHFLEYALLGFLSAALLLYLNHRVLRGRGWLWATWVAPPLFCLVYAISDEIHQIFSGRGPAVKDVLIDLAGAIAGCLLMHAIVGVAKLVIQRRKGTACRTHATP